jgi:hypothetical protein
VIAITDKPLYLKHHSAVSVLHKVAKRAGALEKQSILG